jgi:AP2 domain
MLKRRVRRNAVTQPSDPSYRIIPLTQNQNAIVDARDFSWLSQWNWFAQWAKHTQSFYAKRCDKNKKTFLMSREILNAKPEEYVDHRNHNTLDNRRRNLRRSKIFQNNSNQGVRKDNSSGYKGVCFRRDSRRWQAYISYRGNRKHLGYFKTSREAAEAYNVSAKRFHGSFAYINSV